MKYCKDCPLRLFNNKHYNLQGYGNPWNDKLIIVPNVDYNAYKAGSLSYSKQVEVITSILSSTGEQEINCYILPLIRCNENIGCKVNDDILNNCLQYLKADIKKYNWHNIMVCGRSWDRLFNRSLSYDLDKIVYSVRNNRIYFGNYNPLVKYVADCHFDTFKNRLIEWYHNPNNLINGSYEMLYL